LIKFAIIFDETDKCCMFAIPLKKSLLTIFVSGK